MKRRNFIKGAAVSALGAGLAGCSSIGSEKIQLTPEGVPFSFGDNYPKPKGGSMPRGELGKTGIKVSKFAFGSHMRPQLVPYTRERERMLRDAYELGVNVFDVYDVEHGIFQYAPTGKYLAPMINDVVISIAIRPYDGRTLEEELHRDLKLFGRDYIDMVRIHAWAPDNPEHGKDWWMWEQLFKYKEQGKIRAVGLPIHTWEDLKAPLEAYPLDYVIFPFNFFHSIAWDGHIPERPFETLPGILRSKGVGVVTMKPFAGDFLVNPLMETAKSYDKDIDFPQACLRYIINSGLNPDTTLTGMYYPSHVYENIDAYYNPQMSDEEKKVLEKVKKVARTKAQSWLPEHYRFLDDWAPHTNENSNKI